jgi:hypothetical protein
VPASSSYLKIINEAPGYKKINEQAGCWWLTPIILATQEAEIRRIAVQSLAEKNPLQIKAGGVAQGVGPEFKPQCCKKKKIYKQSYM